MLHHARTAVSLPAIEAYSIHSAPMVDYRTVNRSRFQRFWKHACGTTDCTDKETDFGYARTQ